MKFLRIIALFLCIALPLTFACSCGSKNKSGTSKTALKEENEKGATIKIGKDASFVKPVKYSYSQEEQEILDFYYGEMVKKYPSFGSVPRDMLDEFISRIEDSLFVSFTFCFGGVPTGCYCSYFKGALSPEGEWTFNEDSFSSFYRSGLDDVVMNKVREKISAGISGYIDSYHLEKTDLEPGSLSLYWEQSEVGALIACEQTANVTSLTSKNYGCGDHAHVICKILVEIAGDTVKLTYYPATGS